MTILYPKEKNLHGTVSLLSNNNEICDERLTIEFFLLGKQWEVAWCCLPDFISEEKLKSDWQMHLTCVLCNRQPFSKNGIFPNLIEQKTKKMHF